MDELFLPLSEEEMDWLDHFLAYRIDEDGWDGRDEGVLNVCELDGMLTAVVSSPQTVPPSSWMPKVWGDFPPRWQSEREMQKVISLLMRHANSLAAWLSEAPDDFEPMFEEDFQDGETYLIVDEWCEGYMRGVALAADAWQLDTDEMKDLLWPIMAFTEAQGFYAHENCTDEEYFDLQDSIAPNARDIHARWRARRARLAPAEEMQRIGPIPGRDDPCPCGSGKPFRKCCLH